MRSVDVIIVGASLSAAAAAKRLVDAEIAGAVDDQRVELLKRARVGEQEDALTGG
jgi:ribulose 1,5-bisphosphate synthetase/thiazole synthase